MRALSLNSVKSGQISHLVPGQKGNHINASKRVAKAVQSVIEQLENRRLLSAPVANDDFYTVAEDEELEASSGATGFSVGFFDGPDSYVDLRDTLKGGNYNDFMGLWFDDAIESWAIIYDNTGDRNRSELPTGGDLIVGETIPFSMEWIPTSPGASSNAGDLRVVVNGLSQTLHQNGASFDGNFTHFGVMPVNADGRSATIYFDDFTFSSANASGSVLTTENFDSNTDSTWNHFNNTTSPQNYAWSGTDFTGNTVNPPGGTASGTGEMGGVFTRDHVPSNFYGFPVNVDPSQPFQASGVIHVVSRGNGVLANDINADPSEGRSLSAVLVDDVEHGTLLFETDGSFTYQPDPNFFGTDTFTYQAKHDDQYSDPATVTIEVTSDGVDENTAPVANPDSYTVAEDDTLNANDADGSVNGSNDDSVLVNDTDADLDALTAVLVSGPSHGALALNSNGTFTYMPAADYFGPDSFTYKASDGTADSSVTSVSIDVTARPDVRLSVPDSNVGEGHTSTCRFVFTRDEPTDAPLTVHLGTAGSATNGLDYQRLNINVGGAVPGTIVIPAGQASVALVLEARFDNEIEGDETIVINLEPDAGYNVVVGASSATATIIDSPIATPQSVSTPEDTAATITLSGEVAYNDNVTFQITSLPAHGTLYDGATPIAAATPASPYVLATPASPDMLYTRDVRYEPAANYQGPDVFNFRLRDAGVVGAAASVSINVTPVNDAPTANDDDAGSTPEDNNKIISTADLLANDSVVPPDNESGQSLQVVSVTATANTHGTVTLNDNGTPGISSDDFVVYDPDQDYNGPASFEYTIQDNGTTNGADDFKQDSATVSLTVTPVNDDPIANPDAYTVAEGGTLTANDANGTSTVDPNDNGVLANDTDVDVPPDTLTAVLDSGPANAASFTLNSDGTFTYVHDGSETLTDSFTYHVNDGTDDSNVTTVTITITPVNDAPVAVNDGPYTVGQGGTLVADDEDGTETVPANDNGVLANDTDADLPPDTLTAVLVTGPSNGTVTLDADGSFIYTPSSTFSGTDTFTYMANDGQANSNVATVTIVVTPAGAGTVTTIPDTCHGGTALLIVGTSGDDQIHISPGPSSSTLYVTINGMTTTEPKPTGRIIVIAGDGDDNVQVAGAINNSVWLYGDAGNDRLNADNDGTGGNLLIGGDGNDELSGGLRRDVMIGGQGADKIIGNANDDILVAGYTLKDERTAPDHEKFWCDVMDEWTSGNSFTDRVNNLRNAASQAMGTDTPNNNGSYLLDMVRDDGDLDEVDMLQGSAGNDWFIYATGEDKVVGQIEASDDDVTT